MVNPINVYTSNPFPFIVGGLVFHVHGSLIAEASKPLHCLMTSKFKENEQGYAELFGVDVATFTRFMEWLYHGYYTAPEPERKITRSASPGAFSLHALSFSSDTSTIVAGETSTSPSSKKRCLRLTKPRSQRYAAKCRATNLREDFASRRHSVRQTLVHLPQPRPNHQEHANYTEVFLSHAALYVWADEKDIPTLRTLALEELHAVLSVFTLYDCRVGDVISLAEYVYGHTRTLGDQLRELLADYLITEAEVLLRNDAFKTLLFENGGALYDDFFVKRVSKMVT